MVVCRRVHHAAMPSPVMRDSREPRWRTNLNRSARWSRPRRARRPPRRRFRYVRANRPPNRPNLFLCCHRRVWFGFRNRTHSADRTEARPGRSVPHTRRVPLFFVAFEGWRLSRLTFPKTRPAPPEPAPAPLAGPPRTPAAPRPATRIAGKALAAPQQLRLRRYQYRHYRHYPRPSPNSNSSSS